MEAAIVQESTQNTVFRVSFDWQHPDRLRAVGDCDPIFILVPMLAVVLTLVMALGEVLFFHAKRFLRTASRHIPRERLIE